MIKPDGVQRGLIAEVIQRFTNKGYNLLGLKMVNVSKTHAETHYADLAGKKFFPGLIEYITSGPVVAMCWEGKDVIKQGEPDLR